MSIFEWPFYKGFTVYESGHETWLLTGESLLLANIKLGLC